MHSKIDVPKIQSLEVPLVQMDALHKVVFRRNL